MQTVYHVVCRDCPDPEGLVPREEDAQARRDGHEAATGHEIVYDPVEVPYAL